MSVANLNRLVWVGPLPTPLKRPTPNFDVLWQAAPPLPAMRTPKWTEDRLKTVCEEKLDATNS